MGIAREICRRPDAARMKKERKTKKTGFAAIRLPFEEKCQKKVSWFRSLQLQHDHSRIRKKSCGRIIMPRNCQCIISGQIASYIYRIAKNGVVGHYYALQVKKLFCIRDI